MGVAVKDLRERTRQFGLGSLAFHRRLPSGHDAQTPGRQFLRAALAVGANYRAARRARSRTEFIAKLGIVVEEIDECVGWLELMRDARIRCEPDLLAESHELAAILTAALKTARINAARHRTPR